MKTKATFLCGTALALAILPGCDWFGSGSESNGPSAPAMVCTGYYCDQSSKLYQHCFSDFSNETYEYGPNSCTCASDDTACLTACTTAVATYCGIPTEGPLDESVIADAGNNDDGGTNDGGTNATCTASFSGAVVATSACNVSLTDWIEFDLWELNVSPGILTGSTYEWSGISFARTGALSIGTFNQSGAFSASAELGTPSLASPVARWEAMTYEGASDGAAALTISALGDGFVQPEQIFFNNAHGTWTGTLTNTLGGQAPVQLTVTF